MSDRANAVDALLANAGWSAAIRAPLAGDASNRRYERLALGERSAVLMDAPPDKGEDVRPFLAIANHLSAQGLSAPEIYAADETHGLLLIEDLGDALFTRVVAREPARETELYIAATDALIALHAAPLPDAPDYGPETMSKVAGLAADWYAFGATGDEDNAARERLVSTLFQAFQGLSSWKPVLVLRDYHAENLLWLPDRPAQKNVGLLDFQDAGIGHPAYDLMSLARDARRDVSPETIESMIAHYIDRTGQDAKGFRQACATVSAQRNLRILGVFARLSLHFGKPHYVDFIPRVWRNLMIDLSHPGLSNLAVVVAETLPEPSPSVLATLKEKCGTIPKL